MTVACPECNSEDTVDLTGRGHMSCITCRYKWRTARHPRSGPPPQHRGPAL